MPCRPEERVPTVLQVTGFGHGFNRGMLIEYAATPEYPAGSPDNTEQLAWTRESIARIAKHSPGTADYSSTQCEHTVSAHTESAVKSDETAVSRTTQPEGEAPRTTKRKLESQSSPSACAWACCDSCYKWRRVCVAPAQADPWSCRDNSDTRYNKCSCPQELTDKEIDEEIAANDHSGPTEQALHTETAQRQIRRSPHYLPFFKYIHHRQLLWAAHTSGTPVPDVVPRNMIENSFCNVYRELVRLILNMKS